MIASKQTGTRKRLNDQLAFRVPHGVRRAVERAARVSGQRTSDFCRDAVLAATQRVLVDASKARDGLET
jgi:uncharacterized protein (DUF1778 family)